MAATLKLTLLFLFCNYVQVQSLAAQTGPSVVTLKEWQDLDNRLASLHRTKKGGACLFVWTRLFSPVWDLNYQGKYLSWVKAVLFESMARQCPANSPCNSLSELKVVVKIQGDHTNNRNPFLDHLKQSKSFFSFHDQNAKERTALGNRIKKMVQGSNCLWVGNIWIDADDGFGDGFFQHITAELPRQITMKPHKGTEWRGAVITGRHANRLVLGNNKCGSHANNHELNVFYAGLSPAQGFILRRYVWDKLTTKVMYPGMHFLFARQARMFIMHGLGVDWTPSSSQWRALADGDINAEETRILLIDFTRQSKKHSLFLHTPFSSHYPWTMANQLPICGPQQKREMEDKYSKSISYLLDATNGLHLSMQEVCKNNPKFQGVTKYGLHCNK